MIPSISGAIDHVHVYVPERRAAADWYRANLGFQVVEKFAFWADDERGPLTITDPGDRIHFALFRSADPKPVSLAFGVSGDEYAAWRSHLASQGLPTRESDHGLCHSMYFADPYGNQFEITTFEIA